MNVNKKKIQTFEELEYFLNKSSVSFPKEWRAKFSIKKRKARPDEIWKDYRIFIYSRNRLEVCEAYMSKNYGRQLVNAMKLVHDKSSISELSPENPKYKIYKELYYKLLDELIQYTNVWDSGVGIEKKNNKIYYNSILESKYIKKLNSLGIKIKVNFKFPNKMESIKSIVQDKFYWKQKESVIKLGLKTKKFKTFESKFNDELENFEKCVTKISQKKYTKNFFISYQPKLDYLWHEYWGLFQKVK